MSAERAGEATTARAARGHEVAATALAVLLGAAGSVVAGPEGALALAAGGPVLTHALATGLERRAQRQAALVSELDPESASAALASLPAAQDLFVAGLEAAGRADSTAKVRALAEVLRDAFDAASANAIDVGAQLIATIDHLTASHVRVLAVIEESLAVQDGDSPGADREYLLVKLPQVALVIDKLLAECEGLGLIYDSSQGTMGQSSWERRPLLLTDYGRACLARMRLAGAA